MFTVLLTVFHFLVSFQNASAACDVASITTVSGTHAPRGKICPGDLIFEDNFDELDLKKWQHEITLGGGGNWEFQWYANNRSNSYVENGTLHIRPTLVADEFGEEFLYSGQLDINGGAPDACTNPLWNGCVRTGTRQNALNPVKSAKLRLLKSLSFKYGKVEVRAKLPAGDWLWPAIWLLPRYSQYSGWPASGEIDIMEGRGNRALVDGAGVNFGTHRVESALHWGPNYNYNRFYLTRFDRNNDTGYNTDFHSYQMEWTPDKITFSTDGIELGTVSPPEGGFWQLGNLQSTGLDNPWKRNSKMAPFDQEFYLNINLAVGGLKGYFPDDANNPGGKPWNNSSPTALTDFWKGKDQWLPTWKMSTDESHLQIDYVKIWAL